MRVRDPQLRTQTTYKAQPMATRKVRVLIANFYSGGGHTPKIGEVVSLDADLALAMAQQGRVEYVAES